MRTNRRSADQKSTGNPNATCQERVSSNWSQWRDIDDSGISESVPQTRKHALPNSNHSDNSDRHTSKNEKNNAAL